MKKTTHTARTRSPNGVEIERPIALRLMQNERAAVANLANRQGKTLSATARSLTLRGLKALQEDAA